MKFCRNRLNYINIANKKLFADKELCVRRKQGPFIIARTHLNKKMLSTNPFERRGPSITVWQYRYPPPNKSILVRAMF